VPPVASDMLPMVAQALDLSDGVLAILERAPDASGTLAVRQVNGAFCRALAAGADALEGQPLAALAAPGQEARLAALAAAAARGEAHRTELIFLRPNETRLWLGVTLMPAKQGASTQNLFVMLARDITQSRQEAEQQGAVQRLLANVFSMAEAGLAIVGQDGRFLMTNAFHDRLLGCAPGGLTGRATVDYVAPDSREPLRQARAQQSVDMRRYALEISLLTADGSHVPVTLVSAVVSQNEAERFRVVTVIPRGPAVPAVPLHVHLTGKIRMIGLEEVKAALGERWASIVERVMDSAERVISRQMAKGDTYFRTKDHGFVVCFPGASEEEATLRAAAIAREIRQRLIGAGEDPATVEVSAVVAPLPSPPGSGAPSNAKLDRGMAHIEQRLRAEARPTPGAAGFVVEPVIGREQGPVLGYYLRALLPPREHSVAVSALPADRFEADLAALRFAERVALERLSGGNEALFVEIDFDCFFNRARTQTLVDLCHGLAGPARERIVPLLAGLTDSVAPSRVLESVQRLRSYCRAVGFALETPELRSGDTLATVSTFVLLKTHAWDRSKAVARARITKLAAVLHARKSSLMAHGVDGAGERDALRNCGVNLFVVTAPPG
jgi:PAS domain S-box-containing protein